MSDFEEIQRRLGNPEELRKILETNPDVAPLEEQEAGSLAPGLTPSTALTADPCTRHWFFIGQPPGYPNHFIFSARSQGKCATPIVLQKNEFTKISENPIRFPCLLLRATLPVWEIKLKSSAKCRDTTNYPHE